MSDRVKQDKFQQVFMAAVEENEIDVVKFLLKKGANKYLNKFDSSKNLPLHWAFGNKNLKMVQCLVEAGADIEKATDNDYNIFDIARGDPSDYYEIIKYLVEQDKNISQFNLDYALLTIAGNANLLYNSSLECESENCNINCGCGIINLEESDYKNNLKLVRHLLEKGAHIVGGESEVQWTALHDAVYFKHLEIIDLFMEYGIGGIDDFAMHTWHCYSGQTALSIAITNGNFEIVKCLVKNGANINICDDTEQNYGNAPLHDAVWYRKYLIVKYLVEQDADININNDEGKTPLHLVILGDDECDFTEKDAEILEYLVSHGANIDEPDNDGYTPLHLAALKGNIKAAEALFSLGVKLDLRNNAGQTPYELAISRGHHDFAQAVRDKEIRLRDHGFKRAIKPEDDHEANKRLRCEEDEAIGGQSNDVDESDDDDDDDDDDDGR